MAGSEQLGIAMRTAAFVVPVALYFLLLGLLNSRKRPQVLSGRQDFALLILALSPLFVVPLLNWLGMSLATLLGTVSLVTLAILLLAPRGHVWVIYNITEADARQSIDRARRWMGEGELRLRVTGFSLLRNVTIRLEGAGEDVSRRFGCALEQALRDEPAETSPMAMGLLLVATAMLVAPLVLVVSRVPEMVRLISDLIR